MMLGECNSSMRNNNQYMTEQLLRLNCVKVGFTSCVESTGLPIGPVCHECV